MNSPLEPHDVRLRGLAAAHEPTSVGFPWFQPGDSSPGEPAAAPPLLPSRRTLCPSHPPHIPHNQEAPIQQFAPYIGYVAGALTVISFLPQVVRVWKTKRTTDLSLGMFVILITAGGLWITYGALTSDWPVIATNGGMVALNIAILVAKLRFK